MNMALARGPLVLRCAALLGVAALVTGLLASLLVAALVPVEHLVERRGASALPTLPFPQALTSAAALALLGCWLRAAGGGLAYTTAVVLQVLRRPGPGTTARGQVLAGPLVRRTVLAALGLSLSGAVLLPARATPHGRPGPHEAVPVASAALAGLRLPDRTTGSRQRLRTVTVRPGDSLWSIAERLLPADAGTRQVAAAWHALREANASRIGPDADLIFPGTRLVVPLRDRSGKDQP